MTMQWLCMGSLVCQRLSSEFMARVWSQYWYSMFRSPTRSLFSSPPSPFSSFPSSLLPPSPSSLSLPPLRAPKSFSNMLRSLSLSGDSEASPLHVCPILLHGERRRILRNLLQGRALGKFCAHQKFRGPLILRNSLHLRFFPTELQEFQLSWMNLAAEL